MYSIQRTNVINKMPTSTRENDQQQGSQDTQHNPHEEVQLQVLL